MANVKINYAKRFDFGLAICALKEGQKVGRVGWNGKGMWLQLVPGAEYRVDGIPAGTHTMLPWIGMKTADHGFVPWLASQTDMLAEDWQLVP